MQTNRNMFNLRQKDLKSQATTPDLDLDSSLLDDVDDDTAVDLADVDVDELDMEVPTHKRHFLDYAAVPPPDFEESFDRALSFGIVGAQANLSSHSNPSSSSGEQLKLDKKYERDGEISDYELAASGYTKKEFTQDDNTLHLASGSGANAGQERSTTALTDRNNVATYTSKPKHFLDENPIPPDYMLEHEMREHRSLDRNFERQNEQRTSSTVTVSKSGSGRKSSMDRSISAESRSSRERFKEPSYTLSRFLDSDAQLHSLPSQHLHSLQHSMPKAGAWTDSFDSRYGSLHLPSLGGVTPSSELDALGPKVECVYSLLSMLGSNDPLEMSKKFLELSRTPETCATLRRSGCIPLLVQMMHSAEGSDDNVRKSAGMALHNVVHSHSDEKAGRREAKVLRLLDQIMEYCQFLRTLLQSGGEAIADDSERHPLAAISSLMKVSFDQEHRHAMCELGALQAIPSLVHLDHAVHGPKPEDQCCNSLRRYALMALTNLTFGDENNKALLCSQKLFMEALVAQLDSAPDDLLQVTASVLRNLSWRADSNMKAVLNEIGTVTALARAAMKNKSENTLKAILSALWNLSAHCSTNKAEFCAVDDALAFLVEMLTYEGPSKTLKIIENAGGILRNVSSHIAVREHYRQILREHNCLSILLQQLKSESLTVVSNSCGTLWNLSARCPEDQKYLWDNGAVPMLRSLIHSKHAMISEGSSSALKNLLNFRPSIHNQNQLDPIARSMGLKKLPTLNARRQKALEQELGEKEHAETCDNLDIAPGMSKERTNIFDPTAIHRRYPLATGGVHATGVAAQPPACRLTRSAMLTKSESRDSVFSAKSDSAYEQLMRSHSASDAYRKSPKLPYAAAVHHHSHVPRAAFALKNDVEEPAEEQPIDYSVKYNENIVTAKIADESVDALVGNSSNADDIPAGTVAGTNYATYQETDLDQPTDFSLRYAENTIESDIDVSPSEPVEVLNGANVTVSSMPSTTPKHVKQVNSGSEIMLILEDSVKCYQTEDTPYVISNAASVTDLRQNKTDNAGSLLENVPKLMGSEINAAPAKKGQKVIGTTAYGCGSYTPEKPINYCEEGTPGYFSRYESLSSLDESPPQPVNASGNEQQKFNTLTATEDDVVKDTNSTNTISVTTTSSNENALTLPQLPKLHEVAQIKSSANSAQETPLMFSRHSSMDSLVEEDVGPLDDKSSVVSDFSRLASGVISPSELPDSPTQSMPQSPRRNSAAAQPTAFSTGVSPVALRIASVPVRNSGELKRPLRSVFEDNLNTFHVEHTPAQFSCATSLSNLSILDDEHELPGAGQLPTYAKALSIDATVLAVENLSLQSHVISEGEDEESAGNNDDLLLASCINMGMNRTGGVPSFANVRKSNIKDVEQSNTIQLAMQSDESKHYFTEDTPALLSKVGSNTNLSTISICSSNNDEPEKDDTVYEVSRSLALNANQRHSLNLSDDVSSNASESGNAGQSFDILQQCIRDGMQNPSSAVPVKTRTTSATDPIAMMRRGGSALPPYLPVSDEMNRFLVEDSPCNFSVVSGLSNLTVGSSLVGPALQLQENPSGNNIERDEFLENHSTNARDAHEHKTQQKAQQEEDVRRVVEQQWHEDSLSSLSIDSEDDTNLLSQAIAAGCNRPKSNLGFSTASTSTNKRSTSLSASQPIPINSATSASSLTSKATASHYQRQQQANKHQQHQANNSKNNGNESYSSVDSSDSNDNQSKSLFELTILTGMHKSSRDATNNSRKQQLLGSSRGKGSSTEAAASTQSNPNLKHFDSLPLHQKAHTPNRHLRERERKDEKLLLECINTGISNKIASGSSSQGPGPDYVHNVSSMKSAQNSTVSKNVQATSAVVLESPMMVATTSPTSANCTAAPDVEKTTNGVINSTISSSCSINNENKNASNNNSSSSNNYSKTSCTNISPANIIDAPRNPLKITAVAVDAESPQSPEITQEITNGIGFNMDATEFTNSISLDNTTSDESNESFIMETTVSLEQSQRTTVIPCVERHKDPDLMLKSVERLTLEFVSSAEQLRTAGSSDNSNDISSTRRLGSVSVGATNSNNTWNEDTCPNDVSFPSVSVSAPIVASLKYDDEEDDDDEEQATEADHKELHDFAEITPTNEELPQPSIGIFPVDETDMFAGNTQPNSLETETDTLINDLTLPYFCNKETNSSSISSGINFRLGGEVQSAAAVTTATNNNNRHMFFNNSSSIMTNSTIIAIEARALADNLQQSEEDLTFSFNSLDLDNIRPPSGMDSLNISGYYQDHTAGTQPNSLQQRYFMSAHLSPQLSNKSPKFPRKTLPAGLVARRALGQLPGQLGGSAESINSSCNIMLDNIKPPSLMDELLDSMISVASIQSEVADCESMATTVSVSNYETAAGGGYDFDDNTITLQSCYDNMPHDDADADDDDGGTPLPYDYDFSSAESTPKKSHNSPHGSPHGVKRTLTPKQKRKLAKDRFKTYTIAADIVLNEDHQIQQQIEADETLQIEILETETVEQAPLSQSTSASRRRTSQDRYKTQTIVCPVQIFNAQQTMDGDYSSLTSTDDCASDEISSIRAMTKQFKFITTPLPATSSPPIHQQESDYNSMECDQNSETESCHGQISDTEAEPAESDENELAIALLAKTAIVKPRITKPGDADYEMAPKLNALEEEEEQQQENKAIRGRKKPSYVSPYSMQFQRSNTTTTTTATTRLATNKLIMPTVHLNALRKRNTNLMTPANTAAKIAQKKKTTATTQTPTTNVSAAPPPLERQSTFVKDAPSIEAAKMPIVDAVVIANVSPQSSPTHRTSKLPTKRSSPKITASTRKISVTTTTTSASNTKTFTGTRKSVATAPQRSNSNASIRVTSSAARIAVLATRVSTTTPPSRSNSNLNSANVNAPQQQAATATAAAAKINQAQSRIAGIWKRVDDAKCKQQQQQQQTQKTSSTSQLKTQPSKSAAVTQPQRKQTLVRSTTFDSTPETADSAKSVPSAATSKIAVNRNILSSGNRKEIPARK